MENSRTKKSIKNLIFSFGTQIGVLLINFLSRTIFIKVLGVEVLGINGLFTNILTLLSLAELGFGNAIIYSMYKPVKENDTEKISALMKFYKKIYNVVIIIISVVGIALIPFLNLIVNVDKPIEHMVLYYILFLLNTVMSYVFAYKSSIINVQQKIYIAKLISFCVMFLQFVMQTIVLFITHNYIIYLIIQIICTLLNNIICSIVANRMYPYINRDNPLTSKEKKEIFTNVGSIFLYKLSGTILNNTDNIFISILISTSMVGYYSNYYMIISALTNIVFIAFNSISASVGNLMAEDDKVKQNKIFLQTNLICFIITGFCTLELFGLMNNFITLWIGQEFILERRVELIIIINFYIYVMQNPVWLFRDATGLFNDAKNASIILAIMNIILSLIFGKIFGLFGILLATAISRFLITSWQQPYMLYKKIFRLSFSKFFKNQIYYILVLMIGMIPVYFISQMINETNLFYFIVKGIINTIVIIFIFYIALKNTEEYKALNNRLVIPMIKKVKKKLHN